ESQTYKIVGIYESTDLFAELTGEVLPVYVANQDITNAVRNIVIRDEQVQRADSLTMLSEIFNIDTQEVQLNSASISYDTVKNYLKDTTTLLVMFVAIVFIAILMSVISLKNVFIITDKDRKKEFGLLKSIGATPKDVNRLLKIELTILGLIGAALGIIFGMGVSYFVLKMFIKQLAIPFTWSMIMNPYTLIGSFLVGFLLMFLLGHHSYNKYVYSNAIEDLKDVAYNYDPPRQKQSYMSKSFSWKMFLIYNGRLKKQTRNIFQS
ncbi:MAG: ABC transporter permease, partial [Coprobacillus sp.]